MGTVILYDTTPVYFEEISEAHVLTLFLLYKKRVPNEPPAVSSFSLPLHLLLLLPHLDKNKHFGRKSYRYFSVLCFLATTEGIFTEMKQKDNV